MFDVCCNLLDKGTNVKLLINKTTCFTSHFNFNEQENSEHFKKTAPKGIRTNFFYVTGTSIGNINADDNGAYQNTRKATRTYSYIQGNVIAYEENGNCYFNKRVSFNQIPSVMFLWKVSPPFIETMQSQKVFSTGTVITISHSTNNRISPHVAVLYQTLKPIFESARLLQHGNTGESNSKISYFRTSKEILDRVKKRIKLEIAPKKSMMRMNLVVYFILHHKEQNCETLVKYTGRLEILKNKRSLIQVRMLLMTL